MSLTDQGSDLAFPLSSRPPRRETFLARIPRWKKLSVTALIFALILGPIYVPMPHFSLKPSPPAKGRIADDKLEAELKKLDALQHEVAPPSAPEVKTTADSHTSVPVSSAPVSKEGYSSAASPEAQAAAIAENDAYAPSKPLSHAPDPELNEPGKLGDLPRIAPDGRAVWQAYDRPFNRLDPRPRIAIVITGLGFSRVATDATLQRMPPPVTLGFDVQSPAVGEWLARARQDGHETLLDVPMEPFDYPSSDPGPNTLLTSLSNRDNTERFLWALRQGTGYIGITSDSGSRFSANPEKAKLFLGVMQHRGLLLLDARVSPHSVLGELAQQMRLPSISATRRLDDDPSPEAIDEALRGLEQTARLQGQAVGIATPLPLSLDKIQAWMKDLSAKGFAVAPLSALAGK